jgi:chromosome segregation ATPase
MMVLWNLHVMSTSSSQHRLEQLNARRSALRDNLVRAQTNAETAQRELQRLEAEAKEKYGTSDPAQLQALATQWEEENARALERYEQDLNALDRELRQTQQQLQQTPISTE